jgi:hypothetical protein
MMFPIPSNMHPITMPLAAIEVLDLARIHMKMAADALLSNEGELHDWHECRAHGLVASVRQVTPEITERDAWNDLRPLWVNATA